MATVAGPSTTSTQASSSRHTSLAVELGQLGSEALVWPTRGCEAVCQRHGRVIGQRRMVVAESQQEQRESLGPGRSKISAGVIMSFYSPCQNRLRMTLGE